MSESMKYNGYATLLFAAPTFLSGMGSALDMRAAMVQFNESPTPLEADLAALRSDLMAVGQDMKVAVAERMAAASQPVLPFE
jgi:hypothetical protein